MRLLVLMILLFSFFGCKGKTDTTETTPEPTASEECKALETVNAAYNNYYICNDKDDLFSGISYRVGNTEEQEQAKLKAQKTKECANALMGSYNTVSIKIREQIPFYHNAYQYVVKAVIEEVAENTIPQGQFTIRMKGCTQAKPTTQKDDPNPPFKQCFKELGDKVYRELKIQFKCK